MMGPTCLPQVYDGLFLFLLTKWRVANLTSPHVTAVGRMSLIT